MVFWKRTQHDDERSAKQEYLVQETLAQETLVQEKHTNDAAEIPADAVLPRAANGDVSPGQPQARNAQLEWDDAKMATSFANVVNIQSTREQVDLFFGTNQTWNIASEKTLSIELNNRIILSPFAAKRLSVALAGVLTEYETRYGALDVER
jgi:Protein of unknown function (DUF3467)